MRKKALTSKSFNEGDFINRDISIEYKDIPWGIAKAKVYFENMVYPPRKYHNFRFIRVTAVYGGKTYTVRTVKGEIENAVSTMKQHIERDLV
jgi:hypothetical protein